MARAKVSDGKSVKVTATKAITNGDFVVEAGFHGFAFQDAASGEEVVLDIDLAEFEFTLAGVTVGDVIYYDGTNLTLSADDGGSPATSYRPVIRATTDSDANDVVWGVLLPQVGA